MEMKILSSRLLQQCNINIYKTLNIFQKQNLLNKNIFLQLAWQILRVALRLPFLIKLIVRVGSYHEPAPSYAAVGLDCQGTFDCPLSSPTLFAHMSHRGMLPTQYPGVACCTHCEGLGDKCVFVILGSINKV